MKFRRIILALILAWAGFLHLYRVGSAPPGLQIDEACDVWNANCLLKTGMDEWGVRWPIFAERAFNDYRSTTYIYALIPVEALLGMTTTAARLPAALGAIGTVWLIYLIARRMFDNRVAILAALALTILPWELIHTRWAFEAALSPLLIAASLWSLLWSGAPIVDEPAKPRVGQAIIAGVSVGVSCYGYAAVRVYLPVILLVSTTVHAKRVIEFLRTPEGRRYSIAIILVVLAIALPLFWKQMTDPNLSARANETRVWDASDPMITAIGKVLRRVPRYFGPLLFASPTHTVAIDPPAHFGLFHWYLLPLLLAGAVATVLRLRTSISARTLLVLVLLYPIGNLIFSDSEEIHPLRCFPGIIALCLLLAVGISSLVTWTYRWRKTFAPALIVSLVASAIISHVLFVDYLFGNWSDDPNRQLSRRVDIAQACDWLRPKLASTDAVYFTDDHMLIPHDNILIGLHISPAGWFAMERIYDTGRPPYNLRHVCLRFGKIRIVYHPDETEKELDALAANGKTDHIVMILRPSETHLARGHRPVEAIGFAGDVWLFIFEFDL